jgi:exosortase
LLSARNALFLFLVFVSLLVFLTPLKSILESPLWGLDEEARYTYLLVVPFVSLALVWLERRMVFSVVQYRVGAGVLLLTAGVCLRPFAAETQNLLGIDDSLSIAVLGLVTFWIGSFILCYGIRAFRAGAFPLLLLLLAVPPPDFLFEKLIVAVQYGSTEVCSFIFSLCRVPVLRDGLVFSLPDVTIRVARECSGIHSTLAIILVSLIAAHLFLRVAWKKTLLVLLAVPIVCLSNGVRIAALTLLAQYVNREFLFGRLHHHGGVVFFALALLLLYALLLLLSKETRRFVDRNSTLRGDEPVPAHRGDTQG